MLPRAAYPSKAVDQVFARLAEEMRAIPGIEAVGTTSEMPGDPGPAVTLRAE
jgi:hypothetical protein